MPFMTLPRAADTPLAAQMASGQGPLARTRPIDAQTDAATTAESELFRSANALAAIFATAMPVSLKPSSPSTMCSDEDLGRYSWRLDEDPPPRQAPEQSPQQYLRRLQVANATY